MLVVFAHQYDDWGLPDPTGKRDAEFVSGITQLNKNCSIVIAPNFNNCIAESKENAL